MFFRRRRLSLSKRIALIYSAILFSILILFSIILSYFIRYIFVSSNEEEFLSAAATLENHMRSHKVMEGTGYKNLNLGYNIIYNIYDKDQKLLLTNKPGFHQLSLSMGVLPTIIKERVLEHDTLIVYLNKSISINGQSYYIQVAKSMGSLGRFTKVLMRILMNTSFLGVVICLISGAYLSRKVMKPIRNISNTARDLTSKSLDKRIPIDGPDDELNDLAKTFNSMLERLETDFEKQRRFVYDASHELRTPLSVIYGNINMLSRWGKDNPEVLAKSLATLKYETENMNKLITNLLYLARSDGNSLILRKEDFSLNILLKEVVDETLLIHSQYSVKYICDAQHVINGDYNAIKQVLRILLDNSVKFSQPPGDILIEAEAIHGGTILSVTDKGCGIPQEALPFIFDRFYRADESRTKATGGTGLGLSIAKQIIQSHNGTISAESKLGKGARFEIFLPEKQLQ